MCTDIGIEMNDYKTKRVRELVRLLEITFSDVSVGGDDDFNDGSFMLEIFRGDMVYVISSDGENKYGISINRIDNDFFIGLDVYRFLYFKDFEVSKKALIFCIETKCNYDDIRKNESLKKYLFQVD